MELEKKYKKNPHVCVFSFYNQYIRFDLRVFTANENNFVSTQILGI